MVRSIRAGSWAAALCVAASFACSKPASTTEGPPEQAGVPPPLPAESAEPRQPEVEDEPGVVREGCPAGMVRVDGNDTLSAFCIGQTEVSVAEFRRCVEAKRCRVFDPSADFTHPDRATWLLGDESMPINYVDEEQAQQYCAFVGGRLPQAEEWMWALGSARGWAFPWGNEFGYEKDLYCGCWQRPGQRLGSPFLCSPRQYPDDRTLQGVYDMAGSAVEIIGPSQDGAFGVLVGVAPLGIPVSDLPAKGWTESNEPQAWYGGPLAIWNDKTSFRCVAPLRVGGKAAAVDESRQKGSSAGPPRGDR